MINREFVNACCNNDYDYINNHNCNEETYIEVLLTIRDKTMFEHIASLPIYFLPENSHKVYSKLCSENNLELIKILYKYQHFDVHNFEMMNIYIVKGYNELCKWISEQPIHISEQTLQLCCIDDNLELFKYYASKSIITSQIIQFCSKNNREKIFSYILENHNLDRNSAILAYNNFYHCNNEIMAKKIFDLYTNHFTTNIKHILKYIKDMNALSYLVDYFANNDEMFVCIVKHILQCFATTLLPNVCSKYRHKIECFKTIFDELSYQKMMILIPIFKSNNIIINLSDNKDLFIKACNSRNIEYIKTLCTYCNNFNYIQHENNYLPIIKTKKRKRENECIVCCEETTMFTECCHTICPKCVCSLTTHECPMCRGSLLYFHVSDIHDLAVQNMSTSHIENDV